MVSRIEMRRQAHDFKLSRKWAAIEGYRKRKRKSKVKEKEVEEIATLIKPVEPTEGKIAEPIAEEKPEEPTVQVPEQEIKKEAELSEVMPPEMPSPEFPEEPSLEPSAPKEAAIKINTEPTVIEAAGVISQGKTAEPTAEFIFRMPTGEEIGRAESLEGFAELLRRAPLESVLHHANEQHFSPWLEFKGYRKLAKKIKNISGDSKKVRKKLVKIISRHLESQNPVTEDVETDTEPSIAS